MKLKNGSVPYRFCLRCCGLVVLFFTSASVVAEESDDGWQPFFPDSTLQGWVLTNTPAETWTFENDLLICSGKPIGEMRTARMYQNFILELEWRHMVPKGNAGIFVWADDITAKGVPFHRGIEVQVLENAYGNTRSHTTHGDIFPIHGAKMTPENGRGGSRAFPRESRSNPSPEWNHYRIECRDGEISLSVNGKVVTEGKKCWPKKGYICLESEGGVVHYRNARIKELPDTEIEQTEVAIADRGYQSIYSGLDLRGWKAGEVGQWKSNDWILAYTGPVDDHGTLGLKSDLISKGFLMDFRFKESTSCLTIDGLCDRPIDLTQEVYQRLIAKQGQWNRIEVLNQDGSVEVKLNGEVIEFASGQRLAWRRANAGFALRVCGSIDFANLYQKSRP